MISSSKCKVCTAVVVRGASRCGLCGSKHGMPLRHVLFLGASAALITSLFVMAGRPPTAAELEYHPPRQPPPLSTELVSAPPLGAEKHPGRW